MMGKFKHVMATKLFKTKQETMDRIDKKAEASNKEIFIPNTPVKREIENYINLKEFNDINDISTLKEKLYHLERSFLYEQNSIVEKIEQEKYEIVENFRHEKKLLKKLHDHEKLDLLREIERKDKIIHQLARVFKEEHERKTREIEEDLVNKLRTKIENLNKLEEKTRLFLDNLQNFVENNRNNLHDLENYDQLCQQFNEISEIKIPKIDDTFSESFDNDESRLSLKFDRLLNLNSSGTSQQPCKCKTCNSKEIFDETTIQHELAQIYRRQKSELLRLFNNEKEEYEKILKAKQKKCETEVRVEYENRMAIERKAWQDTIEDYEREISILKFEREQMDRNYCIGMDQMKTEFEREKRTLHRRYREMHAEFKRNMILTTQNSKTDDTESK